MLSDSNLPFLWIVGWLATQEDSILSERLLDLPVEQFLAFLRFDRRFLFKQ